MEANYTQDYYEKITWLKYDLFELAKKYPNDFIVEEVRHPSNNPLKSLRYLGLKRGDKEVGVLLDRRVAVVFKNTESIFSKGDTSYKVRPSGQGGIKYDFNSDTLEEEISLEQAYEVLLDVWNKLKIYLETRVAIID